jgi:hypothetical protein
MSVFAIVSYDSSVAGYVLHQVLLDRAAADEELRRLEERIAADEFGGDVRSAGVVDIDPSEATTDEPVRQNQKPRNS